MRSSFAWLKRNLIETLIKGRLELIFDEDGNLVKCSLPGLYSFLGHSQHRLGAQNIEVSAIHLQNDDRAGDVDPVARSIGAKFGIFGQIVGVAKVSD